MFEARGSVLRKMLPLLAPVLLVFLLIECPKKRRQGAKEKAKGQETAPSIFGARKATRLAAPEPLSQKRLQKWIYDTASIINTPVISSIV